jgi:adenosylcobinamide-GDP ribazoletransferase
MTELKRFFTAVQFFTRLPVPRWVGYSQEQLNASSRYFPAVGWLLASLLTPALAVLLLVLPAAVAVLITFALSALLTGAFHEDGLTDSIDGLGGSYDRDKALEIMKDSRIGSFGALGLFLLIAIKWQALIALPIATVAIVFALAQPWSRWLACCIMRGLHYVREDNASKSKPLAVGMTNTSFITATFVGAVMPVAAVFAIAHIAPHLTLPLTAWFAGALLSCLVVALWAWRLQVRLGGYVGDTLGAAQQLAEAAVYVGVLAGVGLSDLTGFAGVKV